ncbi:hypothetical protein ElyMa_006495600 [Elysia marginata]|uniref:MIB/HERC2 domain-containing protein n=1 Tax=Elysia marginata TaxID=1093978 RepID=A0AAV4I351_9GAST|nr:hypothetical protein ElyMa_006495600 [Elysia marginata]
MRIEGWNVVQWKDGEKGGLGGDKVEKIFDTDWKFELETGMTTDPNTKDPSESKMCRESSKLALSEFYHVDEAEYSRHRRVSYPHIHQPLRSLSNKSLSKTNRAHRAKRKHKKKKKKEKMRSFPSQSAIKSPTIIEEEESHGEPDYYDPTSIWWCVYCPDGDKDTSNNVFRPLTLTIIFYTFLHSFPPSLPPSFPLSPQDSASSSVSEEEEFEEEFDEEDLGVPISTTAISFEPVPSTPKDSTDQPGSVQSAPALNVIPATPSLEKFVDSLSPVGGLDSNSGLPTPTSPAVIPVSSTTSTAGSSPGKEHPVTLNSHCSQKSLRSTRM